MSLCRRSGANFFKNPTEPFCSVLCRIWRMPGTVLWWHLTTEDPSNSAVSESCPPPHQISVKSRYGNTKQRNSTGATVTWLIGYHICKCNKAVLVLILSLLCALQILGHILDALASLFETVMPIQTKIKALTGNDANTILILISNLFHHFIDLACLCELQH